MTAEQLSEWTAYDRLEPIGEGRADARIAKLCAVIVNLVQAVFSKDGEYKPVSLTEFMIPWDKEEEPKEMESAAVPKQQSLEDMLAVVHAIAKGAGAQNKGGVQKGGMQKK